MLIGCPKETAADEKRVALTPDSALQLQKLGYKCMIESGAGDAAGFNDSTYEQAGVTIAKTAATMTAIRTPELIPEELFCFDSSRLSEL